MTEELRSSVADNPLIELIFGERNAFAVLLSLNIFVFICYVSYRAADEVGLISGDPGSGVLYLTVIYSLAVIFLSGLLDGGLLNGIVAGFIVLFAELLMLAGSFVFDYSVVDRFTSSLPMLSLLFLSIAVAGYTGGRIARTGLLWLGERWDIDLHW